MFISSNLCIKYIGVNFKTLTESMKVTYENDFFFFLIIINVGI